MCPVHLLNLERKSLCNVLYEAKTLHALDEQIYQAWILIISNSFKAQYNHIYGKVTSSTRFVQ